MNIRPFEAKIEVRRRQFALVLFASMLVGALLLLSLGLPRAPGVSAAPAATAMPAATAAPAAPAAPQPVARAPRTQPFALLPGDTASGPAALNQNNPQIAAGNGGYLVVWEDSRTNYAGILDNQLPPGGDTGGQTLKDIYAARLDSNGQLIDTTPIVVSEAPWSQTLPRVAWNGQNWLVVWNTERVAGFTSTKDIAAARVSPAGVVLDSPAIVVDGSDTVDELYPAVASDGNNWVVIWMDQGSYYELRGARISPQGVVLDPAGVAFYTPQAPNAPYNSRIAFAGDEYLVTFPISGSDGDNIAGLRINTSLQPIGGPFSISSAIGYQDNPAVTSNGTDFFVAWRDNRDLQTYQVYGARVSHAGQVLDPGGINLSSSNGGYPEPEVSWDGLHWYTAWDTYGNNVRAARVSTSGQVLDPGGVLVSGGSASQVALAGATSSGGGARLVWTDTHAGGSQPDDIYGAGMASDGSVGTAAPISLGAPSQRQPRLAPNGNGYLAVFLSEIAGDSRIKAQRLDASGNAIDPQPFLITGGSTANKNPAVGWNGSVYLVVWENNSTIFGRRVLPDGTVLDPTPITIMPGNGPDVAALGGTFLVTDTHEPVNHTRYTKAVRVAGDGVVLGATAIVGGSFSANATVAAFGSRWLVVIQHHVTHDNSRSTISADFVNDDGTPVGEFFVAGNGILSMKSPTIGVGPAQALIAYFQTQSGNAQSGDIFARRILPDGTLLDSSPGIQVTSAPQAQFAPSAAWTGSEYVIAYEDYRNVAYLDRAVSDIYATRVDVNGAVLDPNGFVVANRSVPEVQPQVAALSGSYLISFSDFRDEAPYAGYRATIQNYQPNSTPTPASTNTPTPASTSSTATASPTSSAASPTFTRTSFATGTRTPTPTSTANLPTSTVFVPTSTSTATTATTAATATTATPMSTSVSTSTATAISTATPVACSIQFTDVPPGSTFYAYVECLACHGIISGYSDGTFRPFNNVTRGQAAKIVANAAGYSESIPPTQQTFSDVPPDSTFWVYIERVGLHGAISGYSDGTYRPFNNVTRGQLSKIDADVAGYNDNIPPTRQTFSDVPVSNPFWVYIERVALHGVVSGYSDGTFRPFNNVTRGQASKIVSGTFLPQCATR